MSGFKTCKSTKTYVTLNYNHLMFQIELLVCKFFHYFYQKYLANDCKNICKSAMFFGNTLVVCSDPYKKICRNATWLFEMTRCNAIVKVLVCKFARYFVSLIDMYAISTNDVIPWFRFYNYNICNFARQRIFYTNIFSSDCKLVCKTGNANKDWMLRGPLISLWK